MRVLIVENEWLEAMHLTGIARGAGHTVLGPFGTSGDALDAADELPDLALVDINLNGRGDGLELAETLWHVWQVPSVFITAVEYEFAHADAVARLLKPYSDHEIVATLEYVGARIRGGVGPTAPARLELSPVAARRLAQFRDAEIPLQS
jgi:DNA-binding LytR/AlgR family response regulator